MYAVLLSHLASGRGCVCVVLPYSGMVTTTSTLTNEYADMHFFCGFCNGSTRHAALRYPHCRKLATSHNHVVCLNERMQNVNNNRVENALVSQQCSKTEVQGTQKIKVTMNTSDRNAEFRTMVGKIGPRHVGTSGCLIIGIPTCRTTLLPLKLMFFKFLVIIG